jgi:hypothetical protein
MWGEYGPTPPELYHTNHKAVKLFNFAIQAGVIRSIEILQIAEILGGFTLRDIEKTYTICLPVWSTLHAKK